VLAGFNIYFAWTTRQANDEKTAAYEQKLEFMQAAQDLRQSSRELTRTSRTFIVSGDSTQLALYWAEYEADRADIVRQVFVGNNAPANEIYLLSRILTLKSDLRQMEIAAIELTQTGHYEASIELIYSPEYERYRYTALGLLDDLMVEMETRLTYTVDSAVLRASSGATMATVATVLFAIISVAGGFIVLKSVVATMKKEREMATKLQAKESNERMMRVFNAIPTLVNIFDPNLKMIDCNMISAQAFGHDNKQDFIDGLKKDFFKYSPELQPCGTPSKEKAAQISEQAILKGYVRQEWMHLTVTGEELPVDLTFTRVDEGESFLLVAYLHDLRDIKKAQQAEQDTNEFNQAILDAAPYVIGLWDETGNLLVASPQAREFFGVPDPKMIAEDLFAYSPELQPCGTPTPEKAAKMSEIAYRDGYNRFEWLHKRTDGELVPAECIYKIYKHEGKDLLLSYTLDLREIKAAETREKEAWEMSNLLFEAAPIMIEMWDDKMNPIDCNNQVMNFYGTSSKEEFKANYDRLMPEYQPCGMLSKEKLMLCFAKTLLQGSYTTEWLDRTIDGEELPMEVSFVRVVQNDKTLVVAYSYDLGPVKKAEAEARRAEIAEESNKAKSNFLARMSHEIRTPITAVLGISEIHLQNPALPPIMEEAFAKIYSSSNFLLNVVNDILDLSKLEAGKMELVNAKYNVAGMISTIAQMHQYHAGSKMIDFRLLVSEDVPVRMIGDTARIEQMVNNILSNAFKYTKSGEVVMSVRSQKQNHANATLIISVRDTGLGMSGEELNNIFDEYSRFHSYTQISGTGLGMAIVYSLSQLLNAEINIESEKDVGTTVTVSIPQKTSDSAVIGAEVAHKLQRFDNEFFASSSKTQFVPEKMPYGSVLVVDDVPANLYVAKGMLAFYDLKVDTCLSGQEAIDKVKQGHSYHIIFMDHMMPGMDGIEAMQAIRELGYNKPVIAFTANALIGKAEEFIELGFDGFISKPIQAKHLNAILTRHIQDRRQGPRGEPASDTSSVGIENFQNAPELLRKVRADFVKDHKNNFPELCEAINDGDFKTAHRIAHTLKSLGRLMQEYTLATAAENVEVVIAGGALPSEELLSSLNSEMERILNEIGDATQ